MSLPSLGRNHAEHAVTATRAAAFRASWARAAARAGVVGFGSLGLGVLAVRAGAGQPVPLGWVAAAAGGVGVLALAGAAVYAWRKRPSPEGVRALLDRRRRLGGLLMMGESENAASWSGRLAGVEPLALRWRGGPTLGLLAGAAAFAVAATLVPIPEAAAGSGALNVDRHVEALEQQIELLEEEALIEAQEADALQAAAAAVAEDAEARDPASTWEALDHLAAELAREGAAAREESMQASANASAANALTAALAEAMAEANLTPTEAGIAAGALAQLAQAAMRADGGLSPELAEALAEAGALGLDPETLKKLQEQMAGREAELAELMKKLAEAGLAPAPPGAGQGQPGVGLDTASLKAFLEGLGENPGEGECAQLAGLCLNPGQGGISRGRGDAEMTWRDPTSEEGVSFDPQVLPPSATRDPSQSIKLGTSTSAPEVAEAGGSLGGGLEGVSTAGGGSAATTVLPRHRAAVQRYFERAGE